LIDKTEGISSSFGNGLHLAYRFINLKYENKKTFNLVQDEGFICQYKQKITF
jgi:hypothetical protein